MKSSLMLVPISLALACAACASRPPDPVNRTVAYSDGLDREKMAAVERAALARNVDIHWVNPPRKK